MVAKVGSTARDYTTMMDGLALCGQHKATPPKGRDSRKRRCEGSPPPFHCWNHRSHSMWWRNRSSSKGGKPTRNWTPRSDIKSSKGSKPTTGQMRQPKADPEAVKDLVERAARSDSVSQAWVGPQ